MSRPNRTSSFSVSALILLSSLSNHFSVNQGLPESTDDKR